MAHFAAIHLFLNRPKDELALIISQISQKKYEAYFEKLSIAIKNSVLLKLQVSRRVSETEKSVILIRTSEKSNYGS